MTTTTALATNIDWSNFNSGLVIEVTRPSGVFTCSGVAINPTTVITAAHCLSGRIERVRIFDSATYNAKDKSWWDGGNFEIHPQYNFEASNYKFDLAKIKLTKKLPNEITFYPIAKNEKEIDGKFLRIGFGGRDNKNSRTLITPSFKRLSPLDKTIELNDHFSYSGDSGGPVFIQNQGQMYLVAIHSTLSYGPEGKFSYNPLLAPNRSWLEQ